MAKTPGSISRVIVTIVMIVLPVVLLLSSIRSYRELGETREAYLRSRAATLDLRLESMEARSITGELLDLLSVQVPALVDLGIYDSAQADPADAILRALWKGEALFHTGMVRAQGEEIFRSYTPFHVGDQLRIARIDLSSEAADFLVAHTRHNLWLSFAASLALMLFTIYFLWSERRAASFERRHLELEHLARLGEMSAVLAHEIRNPLGTIKGFVQLALEQAGDTVRPLLHPVLEETARLEKLVNDLLAYGRPRTPDIRPVDWEEIAVQLEAHAIEAIGEKPVSYRSEGTISQLETDPDLLVQVLLNLVHNAIDAVHDTPDATVRLAAEENGSGGYSLIVEDNGPGLPAEVREKLFQPFTTTKANGTGLGLSIARRLTGALGGRLEIGSTSPAGTRAELIFTSLVPGSRSPGTGHEPS